jgi:hypothetical protein
MNIMANQVTADDQSLDKKCREVFDFWTEEQLLLALRPSAIGSLESERVKRFFNFCDLLCNKIRPYSLSLCQYSPQIAIDLSDRLKQASDFIRENCQIQIVNLNRPASEYKSSISSFLKRQQAEINNAYQAALPTISLLEELQHSREQNETQEKQETIFKSQLESFEKDLNSKLSSVKQLTDSLTSSKADFEKTISAVKDSYNKASEAYAAASAISTRELITVEAEHFDEEHKIHRTAFGLWIAGLGLSLAAMVLYILYFVESDLGTLPDKSTAGDVLKHAIPRALVFFGGFWLIAFTARGASSERHNWIVNKHRVNALRTYKSVLSSTTDQHVKDVLLVQAASTIFLPQSTGFLKDEVPASDSPKLSELVKVVMGGDKGAS